MCRQYSEHFAERASQRFGISRHEVRRFAHDLIDAIHGHESPLSIREGEPMEGKRRFYVDDRVKCRSFEVIAAVDGSNGVENLVTILPAQMTMRLRRHRKRYKRKANGAKPAEYADYIRLFGKAPAGMEAAP